MPENNINFSLIEVLNVDDEILVSSHHNPDGDAVGSTLGLYALLKKLGYSVKVILPNDYPGFLKWMPHTEDVIIFEQDVKKADKVINDSTVIFALDYNNFSRVKDLEGRFRKSTARKILIDHHLQPDNESFDHILSYTDVSSTAELVYDLIVHSDLLSVLDADISTCLFVGIMTDTGSFSYACNSSKTFTAVADFVKTGINVDIIHRKVYDTFSEDRLRLLGYCLSDKLVVLNEFSTAYISLTKEELNRFHHQVGDTEGIVNYALSIKGIKLAAFFAEREKKIRISLRSKGNISVNEIARKYFLGGGHKNAAGGDSFDTMENTIERFRNVLYEYKEIIEADSDL